MTPVTGLHADDGHDDLFGHAVGFAGAGEGGGVFAPEAHAALATIGGQEDGPVFLPGLALGGAGDGIEDGLVQLHVGKQGLQVTAVEIVFTDHFVDEARHQFRIGLRLARGGDRQGQGEQQKNEGFHDGDRVRWQSACDGCEWT